MFGDDSTEGWPSVSQELWLNLQGVTSLSPPPPLRCMWFEELPVLYSCKAGFRWERISFAVVPVTRVLMVFCFAFSSSLSLSFSVAVPFLSTEIHEPKRISEVFPLNSRQGPLSRTVWPSPNPRESERLVKEVGK